MTATRDWRDVAAGLILLALGLAVAIYAGGHYRLGRLSSMGPGFFPLVLGIGLAVLGLGIAVTGWLRGGDGLTLPRPRALLAVAGAVLVFAASIRSLGFVPASFLLVAVAALADRANRPLRIVILAAVLSALAWLIFIAGLRMPLRAFAW